MLPSLKKLDFLVPKPLLSRKCDRFIMANLTFKLPVRIYFIVAAQSARANNTPLHNQDL